jgi:integrase
MLYTDEQLAKVKGVRERGGKWEAVIHHRSLPRTGRSMTHPTEREARIWKLEELERLEAHLSAVAVAAGVQDMDPKKAALYDSRPRTLRAILKEFAAHPRGARTLNAKTQAEIMANEEGTDIDLTKIDILWTEKRLEMWKGEQLKPNTITKKIGILRAAVKWWSLEYFVTTGVQRPGNPFADMRDGYAQYAFNDPKKQQDGQRDRRLKPGEYEAIMDVIDGVTPRKCHRKINNPLETRTLFRVIVSTGLRLREAYRLRVSDLDMENDIITVRASKMTRPGARIEGMRRVPMTVELHGALEEYVATQRILGRIDGDDAPLFPCWWQGQEDDASLKKISDSLSSMFGAIFRDAGCEDLREHDLRHEATSRWCEMRYPDGRRMYDKLEVMSFTGHTSEKTFMRYLHFFTQDLAPRRMLARAA